MGGDYKGGSGHCTDLCVPPTLRAAAVVLVCCACRVCIESCVFSLEPPHVRGPLRLALIFQMSVALACVFVKIGMRALLHSVAIDVQTLVKGE